MKVVVVKSGAYIGEPAAPYTAQPVALLPGEYLVEKVPGGFALYRETSGVSKWERFGHENPERGVLGIFDQDFFDGNQDGYLEAMLAGAPDEGRLLEDGGFAFHTDGKSYETLLGFEQGSITAICFRRI